MFLNIDISSQVAHKTQAYMVGRQEAEAEVCLDLLIQREGGNKDRALLVVVAKLESEIKVPVVVAWLKYIVYWKPPFQTKIEKKRFLQFLLCFVCVCVFVCFSALLYFTFLFKTQSHNIIFYGLS